MTPSEDQGVEFEGGDEDIVDFSQVADDADILPKGEYNIIVDEAEAKKSSNNNPMIALTMVIEDGEYEGRKLFTNITFSEKSMVFAKKTISRLGLGELLNQRFAVNQEVADMFIGKRARAIVDIRKYEGEDTNNVKKLLPASTGGDDSFLSDDN